MYLAHLVKIGLSHGRRLQVLHIGGQAVGVVVDEFAFLGEFGVVVRDDLFKCQKCLLSFAVLDIIVVYDVFELVNAHDLFRNAAISLFLHVVQLLGCSSQPVGTIGRVVGRSCVCHNAHHQHGDGLSYCAPWCGSSGRVQCLGRYGGRFVSVGKCHDCSFASSHCGGVNLLHHGGRRYGFMICKHGHLHSHPCGHTGIDGAGA